VAAIGHIFQRINAGVEKMSMGGLLTLPLTMWTESMRWQREQIERRGRWFDVSFRVPNAPTWATPNEIVWEAPALKLRKFSLPEGIDVVDVPDSPVHDVPVLIVTPQINHSFICDYQEDQSLVRTWMRHGFKNVYCTEWKSATLDRANETLDDVMAMLEDAISFLGGPVHLAGLCQGGWMSLVHGALRPQQVKSLTLAAAPVDFGVAPGAVNIMAKLTPMMMYRMYVAMGGGILRGELLRMGFNNLRPLERYLGNYLMLWAKLDNKVFLDRFLHFFDWYELPQHLPGASYLKIVKDLFKENRLIKGTFSCRGESVSLTNVTAPLYMIAGERDHITPRAQLFAASSHVASETTREYMADAGHIGVFMGSRSLRDVWPVLFEDMRKDMP
jgi:poly(3-hydroxyalkanoate) synthetase